MCEARFLRQCAFVTLGFSLLACGGAAGGGEPEMQAASREQAAEANQPEPSVAENQDVRMLLRDLAVGNLCQHQMGKFDGLGSNSDEDIKEGRIWIRDCESKKQGDELSLRMDMRAWRWVDKKSKKLGATFEVNQYATMKVSVELLASVELAYAPEAHVLNLWLVPSRPPKASVQPIREMDAEEKGAWSEVLGAFGRFIGKGPDQQATKQVKTSGSKQFSQQLGRGYSVAVDMCTGQRHEKLAALPEGKLPPVAFPPGDRRWLENERVRLQKDGIDLTGPFKLDSGTLAAEVAVEEGGPLEVALVCEADAGRLATAFTEGKRLPRVEPLAKELIGKGASKVLKADPKRCPAVLYTTAAPKAKLPATFKLIVYEPGDRIKPVVPCGK